MLAGGDAERQCSGEKRTLSLFNIHTKESLTVTFKTDGRYDADALKQLNHFMRDWRRNESREMDPELIDLIWTLHAQLGSKEPVKLISAYRSATTNNKLRRKGGGQAKNSQHIQGKAADIQFPDVPVKTLRNSALIQEWGGVGYYPTSGVPFVHVDTGRVRMWPRIARLELAALFPRGRPNICRSTASRSPRKIISWPWRRACLAATRCSPLSGRRRNRQPSQPSSDRSQPAHHSACVPPRVRACGPKRAAAATSPAGLLRA